MNESFIRSNSLQGSILKEIPQQRQSCQCVGVDVDQQGICHGALSGMVIVVD